MPLLSDLSEKLPDDLRNKVQNENLSKLLEKSEFEQLISYLSGNYPWKNKYEVDRQWSLFKEITDYIVEFVESQENLSEIRIENNNKLSRIIQYFEDNETKIVTFNYDTLLEKAFSKIIKERIGKRRWETYWDLPITSVGQRANPNNGQIQYPYDPNKRTAIITKLHGSINWLRSTYNPTFNEPIYYKPDFNIEEGFIELSPSLETNMYGLSPFIIPPAMGKNSFLKHDLISVMWERARNQLENADELVIIGYSIPQSDTYIDLLFSATLNSTQKITIVNEYADDHNKIDFKARIEKYFNKYEIKANFDYLCAGAVDTYIEEEIKAIKGGF